MPCIYEITYIPWVENNEGKPWLYSGSDFKDNERYLGSASSSKTHEWSNGLSVSKWWKHETAKHPTKFQKNILIEISPGVVTREEMQSLESAIQKAEDHRSDVRYFNRTNKHFNSPHCKSALQGLTYEEIFGKDKAVEIKARKSDLSKAARKLKTWSGAPKDGRTSKLKNKSYEDLYGIERAIEMRKNCSINAALNADRNVNDRLKAQGKHVSQIKVTCEYCDKILDKANYTRYHGKKCKHA
jgi:hypothetical protein